MRERAYFWHFWRITPDQYRSLTLREHNAMIGVMREVAKRNKVSRKR